MIIILRDVRILDNAVTKNTKTEEKINDDSENDIGTIKIEIKEGSHLKTLKALSICELE